MKMLFKTSSFMMGSVKGRHNPSRLSRHDATDVTSQQGRGRLACRRLPRQFREALQLFTTISCLRSRFQQYGPKVKRLPYMHEEDVSQDREICLLHLHDCFRPASCTAVKVDARSRVRHRHRGLHLAAVRRRNILQWA